MPSALGFDFGTATSPVAAGYQQVLPVTYSPELGYGWKSLTASKGGASIVAKDSGVGDDLTRDYHAGQKGVFLVDVPNGAYSVTVGLGGGTSRDRIDVMLEGQTVALKVAVPSSQTEQQTFTVTVSDGQLTLKLVDRGGSNKSFAINSLLIEAPSEGPTASFSSNGPVGEAVAAAFTFADQAGGTSYTYSYDFNQDGTFDIVDVPDASRPFTFADNGAYTVTGRIKNELGQFKDYTTTVVVNNVAPTATLGNGGTVNEGSSGTVTFTNAADVSSVDAAAGFKYSYDFNNDGTFEIANSPQGSASVPASYLADGPGSRTVRGRILDKDGGFTDYTTSITISNVAPTATFGNGGAVNEGGTRSVTFSNQADVSNPDALAGFRYSYDFDNDGSFEISDSTQASASVPASYLADGPGSRTVRGRILDKDGGFRDYTTTITINNVAPTASLGNNGPVAAGSPVTITFSNQADVSSVDAAAGYTYSYDFNNDGAYELVNVPEAARSTTFAAAGSYTVRGRITDKDGGSRNYTTSVTVTTVQGPTATLGNNGPVNEASAVTISFTNQSGGTSYTYSYDFNNDGTFELVDVPEAARAYTFADNGAYTIGARIKNQAGLFRDYTTSVTVNNLAPTGSLGNGGAVSEGSSGTVTFTNPADVSSVDAAAGFRYSYDFNNDGTFETSNSTQATATVPAGYLADGPGSRTVRARILDKDGGFTDYTTAITINNVAPTATLGNNGPGTTGNPVAITFSSQADVSSADASAGYRYSYDFNNDGTWELTDVPEASRSSTWAAAGSYTVKGRIKDKDGGARDYTTPVIITDPPSNGLVAAYGFNETSGSTLVDASGNALNGTVAGAAWSASGKYGGALSFDGVNDWVTVADASALDLTSGLTLAAWIYPTTASGTRDVLIKEGAGVDIYNLYARNWRGLPESNVLVGGSNRTAEGASLPVNQWSYLTGTYDGNTLRLYVNGAAAASTQVSGSIATSTGPLRMGGNSIWGEFFEGLIDEVRIYNRALSQAEIQADMNTPIEPPPGDNTPPELSAISATNITATRATVTWTTDEPASSQVEYGLTTGYGSSTPLDSTLATAHSRMLVGLLPNTLYHYRVLSADAAGNLAVSEDFTFATNQGFPAPEAVYVSPTGSDSNPGTEAAPFQTLEKARDFVRSVNEDLTQDLTVYLRGGEYALADTLVLDAIDSGTNGFKVIWKAYPGEQPIITGGQQVSGWAPEANGVYAAPSGGLEFLQFYVNGERGTLARTPEGGAYRTMSWNEGNRTITIAGADAALLSTLSPAQLAQVRITILGRGVNQATLRIASLAGNVITPQEPERTLIFQQDYPTKENRPYFLDNALVFLDSPGEFYVDPAAERVYYQPRAGEDLLGSAVATAPRLEQLLRVEGTLDTPVQNVEFFGLTFQESTWTLPLEEGYIGDQGSFRYVGPLPGDSEYTGPHPGDEITSYPSEGIVAAVHVGYAHNLRFERNVFRNTGGSAVNFWIDVDDTAFIGNVIQRAAASGLTVDLNLEGNPADARKISSNVVIQNNWVSGIGLDYYQALGIMATYTDGAVIEHNEVSDVRYTGIGVGFGWADVANAARNNLVRYNDVHHVLNLMADGGGLYTLSRQPGTLLAENYVHDLVRGPWHGGYPIAGIFLDNGSNLITVRDNAGANVQDSFLFQNANGPSNTIFNNGGSDPAIIDNAGLEPGYEDIIPG